MIRLSINGTQHKLHAEPRLSLLDALRDHLDLTGTKKGCNQGACGACTVLVDGERIIACLALAVQYQGREIVTVEGAGGSGPIQGSVAIRVKTCNKRNRVLSPLDAVLLIALRRVRGSSGRRGARDEREQTHEQRARAALAGGSNWEFGRKHDPGSTHESGLRYLPGAT